MAVVYEIPTIPSAQQFSANLGGKEYILSVAWCAGISTGSIWDLGETEWDDYESVWDAEITSQSVWLLNINDSLGNSLVYGIPIVPGVNLIGQYPHLGINGEIWCQTIPEIDALPEYSTLGTSSKLYLVVQ